MTAVSIQAPTAPASPLLIFRLLAEGLNEMRASRFAGVAYGIVFVLMGYAIAVIYQKVWQMTMGLSAGFFLMGPLSAAAFMTCLGKESRAKTSAFSTAFSAGRATGNRSLFSRRSSPS